MRSSGSAARESFGACFQTFFACSPGSPRSANATTAAPSCAPPLDDPAAGRQLDNIFQPDESSAPGCVVLDPAFSAAIPQSATVATAAVIRAAFAARRRIAGTIASSASSSAIERAVRIGSAPSTLP